MTSYYHIPDEDYLRIHFVRPRFKGNIESVLLFMASECCKIKPSPWREYATKVNKAIKRFPGNAGLTQKTIDNWRTEISALCAFYHENKDEDITKTSNLSFLLNENQDLHQFFKFLMVSFQFPGGHIKPTDNITLIKHGVRFKPAQFIIKVLMAGNEIYLSQGLEKEMSISAEEATYCIFNDLQVTTGKRRPKEVAEIILKNRKSKLRYYDRNDSRIASSKNTVRTRGDVVRYAGDILDYMEIADLLERRLDGYFVLKPNVLNDLKVFVEDNSYFDGYEQFYGVEKLEPRMLSSIEYDWFTYVDKLADPNKFKTDIRSILDSSEIKVEIADQSKEVAELLKSESKTKKEIGDVGEYLVHSHEMQRLKLAGYEDLLHLIKVVDSPSYHPGYDIVSLEGDGTELRRYIEVKTTLSHKKIPLYGFLMSSNEWSVAETIGEHYCVYRLMISDTDKTLYILRNPVDLYKKDKIYAIPRNGMEVTFDSDKFTSEKLLVWKD